MQCNRLHKTLLEISLIAQKTGRFVRSCHKKSLDSRSKLNGSRVKNIDLLSEVYITERIHEIIPDILIVSEERFDQGNIPDIRLRVFGLVDSMDGTEGFIKRNGDFAINIDFIEHNKAQLGVSYSPIQNLIYKDIAGTKSTVIDQGSKERILPTVACGDSLKILLYHDLPKNPKRDQCLRTLGSYQKIMNSNILRFCRIAEGEVNIHVCFEGCYEWATAAGHAVLKDIEGNIVELDDKKLTYGKESFKNQKFITHAK